jgi:DNA-binding MarR family transcriptional regulator
MSPRTNNSQPNYRAMAEFRYQIRRFLRFSEHAAREAGLEPQQYQLLLAVKGLPDGERPRIGDVAERLQIQHHSTVELVDRLAKRSLVRRRRSENDRREVLLELTQKGDRLLQELALHHRAEIREMGPELVTSLRKVLRDSEIGDTDASQRKTRTRGTRTG